MRGWHGSRSYEAAWIETSISEPGRLCWIIAGKTHWRWGGCLTNFVWYRAKPTVRENLMQDRIQSLTRPVSRKECWHVRPVGRHAYEKRGKFFASNFKEAEFYGRPSDVPEKLVIACPLVGDNDTIERQLIGSVESHPNITVGERLALDAKLFAQDSRQLRLRFQQEDESQPGLRSVRWRVHRTARRRLVSRPTRNWQESPGASHRPCRHPTGIPRALSRDPHFARRTRRSHARRHPQRAHGVPGHRAPAHPRRSRHAQAAAHRRRRTAGNHHAPLRARQHHADLEPSRGRLGQTAGRCGRRERHARPLTAPLCRCSVGPAVWPARSPSASRRHGSA